MADVALRACVLACALLLPCAAQAADAAPAPTEKLGDAFPIKRHIRYSFTVQNEAATPLEGSTLAVYAPVRLTSTQRLDALSTSQPARVEVDPWGNQVLRFELALLPPYASRVVAVDAELALADVPYPASAKSAELRIFTRPERYVESDHPKIKAIAQTLAGGTAREIAERTYQWVRQSLGRSAFTAEDRGALRALQDGSGDCTEHAYLVAALLRANGIPARMMGGYLMPENGVLSAYDYHNWAEFFHDGAWHIVDAHQGNFARYASRYVATRVISGSLSGTPAAGQRFSSTGAGLKVRMN